MVIFFVFDQLNQHILMQVEILQIYKS